MRSRNTFDPAIALCKHTESSLLASALHSISRPKAEGHVAHQSGQRRLLYPCANLVACLQEHDAEAIPALQLGAAALSLHAPAFNTPNVAEMAWQTFEGSDLAQCHPGGCSTLTAAISADQLQAAQAMSVSFGQAELALEARAVQRSATAHAPKGHCIIAKQFSLADERDAISAALQQAETNRAEEDMQEDNVLYTARVRQGGNVVVKAWAVGEISQLQSYISDVPVQGVHP